MSGVIDPNDLPNAGTPPFFPSLLASIRGVAPSLPLDPVVLQALLLCILAGDKSLILRTREDDIGSVSKLVASTLTSVFGYTTHKLRVRPDTKHQTPSEFLRSFFLNHNFNALSASDDLSTSSHRPKAMHKRRSGSRTPSFASNSRSRQQSFHRSLSFPFEGSLSSSPPRLNSHPLLTDQKENEYANELSRVQRPLLRPEGVHTDPVPALAKHLGPETISLPRAIVISGLENVSVPAQRALLKALSDKRITLEDRDGDWVWNLPEGFIVIYVCGADPRERPAIHNSLLDRFAMSTSINLHASTQQAIRHMLPYHRTSLSQPAPTADSILPENLMKSLRSLAAPPPLFALKSKTNIHPTLSIYITDLFSAARHHPQLDGMLLTARARQDTEALARAVRVLGGDLTGIEFIRSVGKEMEADSKSFEDSMDGSNIDSLNTDLPQENANGFIHAVHEYSEPQETLDVSEADIARIVPRVLSHRLRVRDGPEDEILGSLEYGAVASCSDWEHEMSDEHSGMDKKQKQWQRSTVKDILVKILAEV